MTQQMDNLLRLINKYSNRFGEKDLLVMDLKKEMTKLQFKQNRLIISRHRLTQSDGAGKAKETLHLSLN